MNNASTSRLDDCLNDLLREYFTNLGDEAPNNLHAMVIEKTERTLFAFVMDHCGGNQSRAAQILGLNRGTLRKKLRQHGLH